MTSLEPPPVLFLLQTQGLEPQQTSSGLLVAAGVAVLIAAYGAVTASSLLLYSPSKLARHLGLEMDGTQMQLLEKRSRDYLVVARFLLLAGIPTAALCIWLGTQPGGTRLTALLVAGALVVFSCGVLPSYLAERRAQQLVALARRTLAPLATILYWPLILPAQLAARALLRILRIPSEAPREPDAIAEEMIDAVSDSAHEGQLPEEEREWIENILELKIQQASEAMTPRTDIVAFEEGTPVLEAIGIAVQSGFSRYPVYRERLDQVVGVFYAKDVLSLFGNGGPDGHKVGEFARDPLFIPAEMGLVELMREFRSKKVQMAIVRDEFGGTVGLVSFEDVLEEVVGEISDEHDAGDSEVEVLEEGGLIEVSGRLRVDEVNDILHTDIPESPDYDTVAGYVFVTLDRIPATGECAVIGDLEFQIVRADERRIIRLRVRHLHPDVRVGESRAS